MKVGFIGLGAMGQPIALNLVRAGHDLPVYNSTPGRTAELERAGARVAESPADAAASAEVLVTMLADDRAVEAVVFGSQAPVCGQPARGPLEALGRGAVHVSMSTISPALSRRLAEAHAAAGQRYVSAPVFGRPAAAAKKLWVVAAAGPSADVKRCRPVLEAVGQGMCGELLILAKSTIRHTPVCRAV